MDVNAVRAAIEGRFLANWTTGGGTLRTPVKLENVRGWLTTTNGATTIEQVGQGVPWVRLTVREGDGERVSLATAAGVRGRWGGLVIVSAFTPAGTGTAAARSLAVLAAAVFERAQFSPSVSCRLANFVAVGESDHYWQENAEIPFSATRIVAG